MSWILTGGAGFIGSAFLAKLNAEGVRDILVVDNLRHNDKWKNLSGKQFSDCISPNQFRASVEADRLQAFGKITAVIHLGATSTTTVTDADFLLSNNTHYSRMLAEAALRDGARFIYASSAATYGAGTAGFDDNDYQLCSLRPQNMYGYSKQLFDEWALSSGNVRSMVGLKFFNVFGPNEYHKGEQRSVALKGFEEIQRTGAISLFRSYNAQYKDGESVRDFVYVKDIMEPLWWLAMHPEVNGIFNVGTGEGKTWNDLARAIFKALGREAQIKYVEMPESMRDRYQYFTQANISKLAATGCPLKFRSLEESVDDYIKNYLLTDNRYL